MILEVRQQSLPFLKDCEASKTEVVIIYRTVCSLELERVEAGVAGTRGGEELRAACGSAVKTSRSSAWQCKSIAET